MEFDHIGIPTTGEFDGEIELPNLRMTVSDHRSNPFGIQWQRYLGRRAVPGPRQCAPRVFPTQRPYDPVQLERTPEVAPRATRLRGEMTRQPCCSNEACIRRSISSRSMSSMWVLSIYW